MVEIWPAMALYATSVLIVWILKPAYNHNEEHTLIDPKHFIGYDCEALRALPP